MSTVTGRINSFQSMGAVDGPGLRCVVFMQGCPLRCAYCHNPETWDKNGGKEIAVSDLVLKIDKFAPYIKKDGGVTVSGGEALMQSHFVSELFKELKAKGYHTALDTSGVCSLNDAEEVLNFTDLVIADIKFTSDELYKKYCGGSFSTTLDFLKLTEKMNIPLWIRQVIVPTINDRDCDVQKLKETAVQFSNVKKIELLPFRKLCVSKYDELGIKFSLADLPECSKDTIERLQKIVNG